MPQKQGELNQEEPVIHENIPLIDKVQGNQKPLVGQRHR